MFLDSINHELLLFGVFNLIVIFMLALDLGFLKKSADHTMSFKRASIWTAIWITTSFIFAAFIYLYDTDPASPDMNKEKTLEFIAAYLLEKSLSVDNLFVFIMIFQKYRIGPEKQPDILKWGIIGAVILRAIMILSGAALISKFTWILYIFGVFLIYTAVKMFLHRDDEEEEDFNPESSGTFQFLKKWVPMTEKFDGTHFFTRENGKRVATPMFVVLVLIELSDVMFAFDSIPAVFSVSQSPFIVYTSNIFAILGLRSLYFMISGIMDLFIYLKLGVSAILAFVGIKMLLPLISLHTYGKEIHVSIAVSLAFICFVLLISILASLPNYLNTKKAG